jgi:hypothetical protein
MCPRHLKWVWGVGIVYDGKQKGDLLLWSSFQIDRQKHDLGFAECFANSVFFSLDFVSDAVHGWVNLKIQEPNAVPRVIYLVQYPAHFWQPAALLPSAS